MEKRIKRALPNFSFKQITKDTDYNLLTYLIVGMVI